jgi:hypothetical protein
MQLGLPVALLQSWIEGSSQFLILLFVRDMLMVVIRFRLVPTFGRSTIRRFANNASETKKMAARNYEDLLQVWPFDVEQVEKHHLTPSLTTVCNTSV